MTGDCEAGRTATAGALGRGNCGAGNRGKALIAGPVANRGTGGRFGVVAGFVAYTASSSPVDASCKYEYKESASSPRAPPHKEGLIGD